jgi:hypothetical protein
MQAMKSLTCACLLGACVLLGVFGSGQTNVAAGQQYPLTLWVPCDEQHLLKPVASSHILVSDAGGHVAKVTVEISWQKGTCFNTTKLWITDSGVARNNPGPAFVYRPTSEYSSGSGMVDRLVS